MPNLNVSSRPWLNDVWGGVAAMLVALPAALAYGVSAYGALGPGVLGIGVRASLIGLVALGFVASLSGGAARLISAPSAPAAAVLAGVGVALTRSGASPAHALVLLAAMSALSGVLQAAYGVAGGGRLIKFIPYPVVAGYLSAVAVMIFANQVPRVLGTDASAGFAAALDAPHSWRWPAIAVGGVTIAAMVFARKITTRVPAAVVALLCGTASYFLLGFVQPGLWHQSDNPLVLGRIGFDGSTASGFGAFAHEFTQLTQADVLAVLVPAFTLSVLLSMDSLKTAVIVDALTFARRDTNRTLLAQGAGNIAAALLGGMPGSATIGPTMVNVESGGHSRLSGVVASLSALIAVLLFHQWLGWLPLSALAGILIVVAARMFDWSSVHLLRQRSTVLDFLVIVTVIAVAIAANLMAAAGAGVALAMVLFIRDQIRGSVLRRKTTGNRIASKQHRLPAEQAVLERFGHETIVCELQGSLFFGTTDQLYAELEHDLTTCRYLVLDLRRVQSLDYTATHLFDQFEAMLRRRGGWLLFSRVPPRRELRDYLNAHAISADARHTRTFETLDDALQWTEDRVLAEHGASPADDAAPLGLGDFELTRELQEEPGFAALSACIAERSYCPGEALFRAGDASDDLFLVRRGVVRVTLPLNGAGYHTLATFGRGAFFGEMAFLVRGGRSADAVATTGTQVFVLSRAHFDAVSRAHPTLGVRIFARLARALAVRLRRADADLRAFYDA